MASSKPLCCSHFLIFLAVTLSFVIGPVYGLNIPSTGLEEHQNVPEMTRVKRQFDAWGDWGWGTSAAVTPPPPPPPEETFQSTFWDWAAGKAAGALIQGGTVAYHVADKVTLGHSSALVDKAKDKAIDMALQHYANSMEKKRQAQDFESVALEGFENQFSVDGKVDKRGTEDGKVQTIVEEGHADKDVWK